MYTSYFTAHEFIYLFVLFNIRKLIIANMYMENNYLVPLTYTRLEYWVKIGVKMFNLLHYSVNDGNY